MCNFDPPAVLIAHTKGPVKNKLEKQPKGQISIKAPLDVIERVRKLCKDDLRADADMLSILRDAHDRNSEGQFSRLVTPGRARRDKRKAGGFERSTGRIEEFHPFSPAKEAKRKFGIDRMLNLC